ncbi:hypothetical protein SAMN02745947_00842 [Rhodococcus rhodochrous J3]|uniref:Uncharacterized protein n=1 Tax=Rhodococcus rhodochrous J3 TaxID=903528 RepID=A0ABY1M640_RHORH|nr:hypothetical protein L612_000900001420 [Rhodococcus rhodochrous J38]SMG17150.1 hypothetical protein SAMN02745947_00842 [Rhodococcus rhodochrous J3]SNV20492.1 Uncharacterised protein [Rhodococcus rhodochrous]
MRTSRAMRAVLTVATATTLAIAACGSDTIAAGSGTGTATTPVREGDGGSTSRRWTPESIGSNREISSGRTSPPLKPGR